MKMILVPIMISIYSNHHHYFSYMQIGPNIILKIILYSYDEDRGPVTNDGDKRRLYGNELKRIRGYDFELNIMKNLHWCFVKNH